jgi:D-alanyl-D-alanine carboxypeptidase
MEPAENIDAKVLQQIVDSTPGPDVVGIIAGVVDHEARWQGGAGCMDLETRRPITPAGHFRIGSLTKTFIAVAVLQLVAEGKLQLEEAVQPHLPALLPAGIPPLTVRQLLQHTSGLADYETPAGYDDPATLVRDRLRTWTPAEIIRLALQQPRAFAPGAGQLYSSTNYILLGLLLEAVTGAPYARQVARGILQPLGMQNTLFPGTDPRLAAPHAQGYITVTEKGVGMLVNITEWNPSIAGAAGEIVSTLADMDAFLAGLFGGRLLPPPLLDEMLRPAPGREIAPGAGYGLGIGVFDLPCGATVYTHGGGVPGYLSGFFANRDGSRRLVASATITIPGQPPVPAISRLVFTLFCGPSAGG